MGGDRGETVENAYAWPRSLHAFVLTAVYSQHRADCILKAALLCLWAESRHVAPRSTARPERAYEVRCQREQALGGMGHSVEYGSMHKMVVF